MAYAQGTRDNSVPEEVKNSCCFTVFSDAFGKQKLSKIMGATCKFCRLHRKYRMKVID